MLAVTPSTVLPRWIIFIVRSFFLLYFAANRPTAWFQLPMTTREKESARPGPVEQREEHLKGRAAVVVSAAARRGDEGIFQRLLKSCDARGWRRKRQRVHGCDPRGQQTNNNAGGTSDAAPSVHRHQHYAASVAGGGVYGREAQAERWGSC